MRLLYRRGRETSPGRCTRSSSRSSRQTVLEDSRQLAIADDGDLRVAPGRVEDQHLFHALPAETASGRDDHGDRERHRQQPTRTSAM